MCRIEGIAGAERRRGSALSNLLGLVMAVQTKEGDETAAVLNAVALLRDLPVQGLVRGQVGTTLEALDQRTSLVEFSDDRGQAYAIVSCPHDALLVLRTIPRAA
jgi:uncharacterized protein DUF4926